MEEPNNNNPSQTDLFESLSPHPLKSGRKMAITTIIAYIDTGQHNPTRPKSAINASLLVSPTTQKKSLEQYKKDRVDKYAQYLEGDRILQILELVEAVQTEILSFVITDLKTRRLARVKKNILRVAKVSRNPS